MNALHSGGHQFIVSIVKSGTTNSYVYDVIFESGYYAENANPEVNRIDFPGSFRLMTSEGANVARAASGAGAAHAAGAGGGGRAHRAEDAAGGGGARRPPRRQGGARRGELTTN